MKARINQCMGQVHVFANDCKFAFDEFMQIYYGRTQIKEYYKFTYLLHE